jgi:5-hydroxyisourate hydrolase
MASKLSTHALDLYHGRPAAGLALRLYRLGDGAPTLLRETKTNADGRTDAPLLAGAEAQPGGRFEIVFEVGAYFQRAGVVPARPAFLDEVPLRFALEAGPAPYHVPLLFSPWAYSTYRGS